MRVRDLWRFVWLAWITCLWGIPPAYSAEPEFAPLEFSVSPAAEPTPALRYHLLVPIEDQVEGNAVPVYLRIVYEQNEEWRRVLREEPSRLLDLTGERFPTDEAGKLVARFERTLEQLSDAAVRSHADWEYVMEGRDPLTILLPDAQSMRNFARLLALKARYEIHSGQTQAAVGTLRDGLSLAKHVAAAPFLVNQLIGVATADVMFAELDGLVKQPSAPNLYWALAELPRPFVALRPGLASESRTFTWRFPELAIPNATHDWPQLAAEMRKWAVDVVKMEGDDATAALLLSLSRPPSAERLATAREELTKLTSFTAEQVAKMSDAEVSVRHTVALHREISDAWRKWMYLPYPQSITRFPEQADKLREEARRRELFPLASVLSPIRGNVLMSQMKIDRQIARLQLIEALRMHASQTGTLPAQLSDVTIVPVPLDPATGSPFAYKLEDGVATLDVTDLMGQSRDVLRMPVRLTLRK
jgi:hypothetical protein